MQHSINAPCALRLDVKHAPFEMRRKITLCSATSTPHVPPVSYNTCGAPFATLGGVYEKISMDRFGSGFWPAMERMAIQRWAPEKWKVERGVYVCAIGEKH